MSASRHCQQRRGAKVVVARSSIGTFDAGAVVQRDSPHARRNAYIRREARFRRHDAPMTSPFIVYRQDALPTDAFLADDAFPEMKD